MGTLPKSLGEKGNFLGAFSEKVRRFFARCNGDFVMLRKGGIYACGKSPKSAASMRSVIWRKASASLSNLSSSPSMMRRRPS